MNIEARGIDGIGVKEQGAPGCFGRLGNGIRCGGVLFLATMLWCVGSMGASPAPGLEPGDLRPGSLTILEDPEGLALCPDGTLYVVLRVGSGTGAPTSQLIRFLPDGTRDSGYAANLPGAFRDHAVCDDQGTLYFALKPTNGPAREVVADMVGTGKTQTLRDRSPVLPHRFYRVQVRP